MTNLCSFLNVYGYFIYLEPLFGITAMIPTVSERLVLSCCVVIMVVFN